MNIHTSVYLPSLYVRLSLFIFFLHASKWGTDISASSPSGNSRYGLVLAFSPSAVPANCMKIRPKA